MQAGTSACMGMAVCVASTSSCMQRCLGVCELTSTNPGVAHCTVLPECLHGLNFPACHMAHHGLSKLHSKPALGRHGLWLCILWHDSMVSVTTSCPALQARCGKDPDVWEQLLRFLLRDATCRKALRKLNTGPAATPAEAMRRQIASKVAEELAATPPAEGQEQAKATPPRPPASAIALG